MGQWRSVFCTYQFGGKISVYLYYNFLFLVISSPFSPISSSPNIKKYSLYQKAYSENSNKILYWIRKTRVYQNIFHLYHSFKWSYLVIAPTSKKERYGTLLSTPFNHISRHSMTPHPLSSSFSFYFSTDFCLLLYRKSSRACGMNEWFKKKEKKTHQVAWWIAQIQESSPKHLGKMFYYP